MIDVTSLTGRQRKPRFVMASGRDSALAVIEFLADAHGVDEVTGNDDMASVVIDGTTYTARKR